MLARALATGAALTLAAVLATACFTGVGEVGSGAGAGAGTGSGAGGTGGAPVTTTLHPSAS